jgi:hypothetical protein
VAEEYTVEGLVEALVKRTAGQRITS